MRFLIALLLITTQASADQVKYLEKGESAPFSGYLFTPELEKEVRIKIQIYESQQDLINILQKRVDNQLQQNLILTDKLQKRETTKFYESLIYFTIGVYATSVVIKSVK